MAPIHAEKRRPISTVMLRLLKQIQTSPTVRTISGVAGGNLLGLTIGLIGTLVQARFVDPVDLGYFRSFSIVTGYAIFAHFGFIDALTRLYPYYIGKGESARATAVAEICQSWLGTVAAGLAGSFLVLGAWAAIGGNWQAGLGWMTQAIAVITLIYGLFLGATYRSGHDFSTVSRSTVLNALTGLASLPLYWFCPYTAMAVRSCAGSIVGISYLHVRRPLRLRWRFDWAEWVTVLKHGLPIFVASYGAFTLWSVVEATLVLRWLGTGALGLWTIGVMVIEMAGKIPQAVVAVYTPRVMETFGTTGSVRRTLYLCRRPVLLGAAAALALAASIWVLLPTIVSLAMPKYIMAVPTIGLQLLQLPITLFDLPFQVMVAKGRRRLQNLAVYSGLLVFVGSAFLANHSGWGLFGVVGASLLGRGVKVAITMLILVNFCSEEDAREAQRILGAPENGL